MSALPDTKDRDKATMEPRYEGVGICKTRVAAQDAVSELLAAGIANKRIVVVTSREQLQTVFRDVKLEEGGPNQDGAILGAVLGSSVGAALGIVGLLTIGGLPIALGALGTMTAGGVAGGLTGAMVERGASEDVDDFYDEAVQQRNVVVAVAFPELTTERTDDGDRLARERTAVNEILAKHGEVVPAQKLKTLE